MPGGVNRGLLPETGKRTGTADMSAGMSRRPSLWGKVFSAGLHPKGAGREGPAGNVTQVFTTRAIHAPVAAIPRNPARDHQKMPDPVRGWRMPTVFFLTV